MVRKPIDDRPCRIYPNRTQITVKNCFICDPVALYLQIPTDAVDMQLLGVLRHEVRVCVIWSPHFHIVIYGASPPAGSFLPDNSLLGLERPRIVTFNLITNWAPLAPAGLKSVWRFILSQSCILITNISLFPDVPCPSTSLVL